MQLWPAKPKAPSASFDAAASRSASAVTITGVELPSSSVTRLRAPRSASDQPTGAEPVKVISRTRHQPREEESRERRLARGLEHHGAAGGECGRDLVRHEVEREVERRDRADDAHREPQREG